MWTGLSHGVLFLRLASRSLVQWAHLFPFCPNFHSGPFLCFQVLFLVRSLGLSPSGLISLALMDVCSRCSSVPSATSRRGVWGLF